MATFKFDNRHGRNRFKIHIREQGPAGPGVDPDDIRQVLLELQSRIEHADLEPAQARRAMRHVATIREELDAEEPSEAESRTALERLGNLLTEFAGAGAVVQGCMETLQRLVHAFQL